MAAAPVVPVSVRMTGLLRACVNGPLNIAITLGCLLLLWLVVPPLLDWAVVRAVWSGEAAACRVEGAGACWAFVREKFWFSIFGLYPYEERWRPGTMLL
ncbi:MAG: amino acid ABC transporter permease, partial [Acetobacteraceae bacterium]|nr:amino acid ABC transporter permease [Acetobacteraceae bacterium]